MCAEKFPLVLMGANRRFKNTLFTIFCVNTLELRYWENDISVHVSQHRLTLLTLVGWKVYKLKKFPSLDQIMLWANGGAIENTKGHWERCSLYCHSPTQPQLKVGIDKVMGWPTPPPKLLSHFKATQEADFQYATLF